MMKINKWCTTWRWVLLVAAAALLIGCSGDDDDGPPEGGPPGMMGDDDEVVVTVETVEVERGAFEVTGDYAGEIRSEQMTEMSPEVPGRLTELAVDIGDPVEAGQLLAEVDDTSIRQTVRELEANARVAEANLEEAKVNLENLESDRERKRPLVDRDMVTEREMEELEASIRSAEQQVAVADAQIEETQARLESAREDLRNTELRAPFDGQVAMRYVDRGTYVGPEQPLYSIVDGEQLYLRVQIPEREAGNIHHDTEATVRVGALGSIEVPGQVRRVSPALDATTRSLRVDVEIEEMEEILLLPGMFARVSLLLGKSEDALTIDNQALVHDADGTPYVWVVEDDEAKRVEFSSVGLQSRDRTEITEKLEEGDRIVLRGHERLEEGFKIRDIDASDADEGPAQPPVEGGQ